MQINQQFIRPPWYKGHSFVVLHISLFYHLQKLFNIILRKHLDIAYVKFIHLYLTYLSFAGLDVKQLNLNL